MNKSVSYFHLLNPGGYIFHHIKYNVCYAVVTFKQQMIKPCLFSTAEATELQKNCFAEFEQKIRPAVPFAHEVTRGESRQVLDIFRLLLTMQTVYNLSHVFPCHFLCFSEFIIGRWIISGMVLLYDVLPDTCPSSPFPIHHSQPVANDVVPFQKKQQTKQQQPCSAYILLHST